jgi:ABC-type sugar transport system substrate-binding protein
MTLFSRSSVRSARRPLVVGLAAAVAISLAACSPTPTPTETAASGEQALRIGFSPFTLQVPALKGLADALTGVAASQGDEVVVADPKADPSLQLQQIQQWVDLDQVDAIWVIPVAGETIASALIDAQAKGIVIVASGVPSDYGFDGPQAGITFTQVDNAEYGSGLGGLATDCIAERLDGQGKIIYLQSASGQQSSELLNTAVLDALAADAPDSTVVNTQEAADRLGSAQLVASALQGAPDANVVIATDDESSLGALDAFKQAGIDPSTVCIVGAGGNDEAKAAVTAGELFGIVAFDFQADLGQNLGELHKLAADPTADGSQLTTPILVITE